MSEEEADALDSLSNEILKSIAVLKHREDVLWNILDSFDSPIPRQSVHYFDMPRRTVPKTPDYLKHEERYLSTLRQLEAHGEKSWCSNINCNFTRAFIDVIRMEEHSCLTDLFWCVPVTQYCGRCYLARYCSVECQREDYAAHKQLCKAWGLPDDRLNSSRGFQSYVYYLKFLEGVPRSYWQHGPMDCRWMLYRLWRHERQKNDDDELMRKALDLVI